MHREPQLALRKTLLNRVSTPLLRKNSRTFSGLSRTPKTFFLGCSILHVHYCTQRHPRPTHLTKCTIHKDAIPTCITYGMPNISKFSYATLFRLVRAQTWPHAHWLIWTTINSRTFRDPAVLFPGLSVTLQFNFQDLSGPISFSRTFRVLETSAN